MFIRVCDRPVHGEKDGEAVFVPADLVTFSLDGEDYETDLCVDCRKGLGTAVAVFVQAARISDVPSNTRRRSRGRPSAGRPGIRLWARQHGYHVSAKGRIPYAVLRAYDEQA